MTQLLHSVLAGVITKLFIYFESKDGDIEVRDFLSCSEVVTVILIKILFLLCRTPTYCSAIIMHNVYFIRKAHYIQ